MPLQGVYIPHFGQILVKISLLGVLYPYLFHRWGEIWHGGGDRSSVPNFTPIGAKIRVYRIGPPKLKFLLIFDQNVEHKRPVGAYPLHDFFYKISTICTPFKDALAVKILLDLLKALWSYGGFNLTESGYPPNFQCP